MGKLGGITLIAALGIGLAACSAPAATEPAPTTIAASTTKDVKTDNSEVLSRTKSGEILASTESVRVNAAALPEFSAAVKVIPGYEKATPEALSSMARELCEHYAGGFTTDDLRDSHAQLFGKKSGDAFAKVGESAISTVCAG